MSVEPDEGFRGFEWELLERYAKSRGAKLKVRVGSEHLLLAAVERGEVDVVLGGIEEKHPSLEKVATTRPYDLDAPVKSQDSTAAHVPRAHVWVVRAGENAFLRTLDVFLHEHAKRAVSEGVRHVEAHR